MQKLSQTLQILLAQFDGQILIPFVDAAKSAGFCEQTARNLSAQKNFPIKSQKRGSRRYIHVSDLAEYIDLKPRGRPIKLKKESGGGE